MNRRKAIAALAVAALASLPLGAVAQAWPTRPITYIVPFTPGGSTDVIGRTVAQSLATVLGQPVVVENKPGAAGAVGAGSAARAKPDGYTLLGGTISTHAINASLYKDLPYDPIKDFEPITLVALRPERPLRQPAAGGELGPGAHRAAQERPVQAHLRLVRGRHLDSPRGRAVRRPHRRGADARALQGQPAGAAGRRGRSGADHVRPADRRVRRSPSRASSRCSRSRPRSARRSRPTRRR